jgi:lipid-A-disaccharide synthase
MDRRDIFVCAGETSGDRMGAPVVEELRRRHPQYRRLCATGVEIRHWASALAVTGISESIGHAGAVARLLVDCHRLLRRRSLALAILIDYPGANLRIARLMKRANGRYVGD